MPDISVRPTDAGDTPELVEVWRNSFGDSPDSVEEFLAAFLPDCGDGIAALQDDAVVSSAFLLYGAQLLLPGQAPEPVTYMYSLGTLPHFRGQGLASAVTRACVDFSRSRDSSATVLVPAGDSLRDYYRRFGFENCSLVREISYRDEDLSFGVRGEMTPVGFEEYGALREKLLAGTPHVRFPERFLSWQEHLCRESGGGMLSLYGGEGLVCAELSDSTVAVKELLLPEGDCFAAASRIFAHFRDDSLADISLRAPAFWPGSGEACPFAMAAPASRAPWADGLYWGFAFD